MPRGCQRPRFGLAIADYTNRDQVWVIKNGSVSMGEAVTKFASFMNGARSLRRTVTAYPARKRKLTEESPQSVSVLALVGINLRISSVQVNRGQNPGRAMTGTRNIHQIK